MQSVDLSWMLEGVDMLAQALVVEVDLCTWSEHYLVHQWDLEQTDNVHIRKPIDFLDSTTMLSVKIYSIQLIPFLLALNDVLSPGFEEEKTGDREIDFLEIFIQWVHQEILRRLVDEVVDIENY